MALSDFIDLDTLVFQDLVDDARLRIKQLSPQWTEYNLSDPGVTLIELFAAMTEKLAYRVNRVPHKSRLKLLEMLGFKLQPPSAARTDITFWLSQPREDTRGPHSPNTDPSPTVEAGCEIATLTRPGEDPIVFTTLQRAQVNPVWLRYVRGSNRATLAHNYVAAWRTSKEPLQAFDTDARGAFYLGFDLPQGSVTGYVLRLEFSCSEGVVEGIDPQNPPLVWEWVDHENYALPAWPLTDQKKGRFVDIRAWEPHRRRFASRRIDMSALPLDPDTTHGLSRPGALILYLPTAEIPRFKLNGDDAYWLRCRPDPFAAGAGASQNLYRKSPEITGVKLTVLGVSVQAHHAVRAEREPIGTSTGEPDQAFRLKHRPVIVNEKSLIASENWQPGTENPVLNVVARHPEDRQPHEDGGWQLRADFADDDSLYAPQSNRMDLTQAQTDASVAFRRAARKLFVIDAVEGLLRFAPQIMQRNGEALRYGAAPQDGAELYLTYHHGGGARGNVNAGELCVPNSSTTGFDRVFNRKRAEGGRDQQAIEELIEEARHALRAQERAVTARDYELMAMRGNKKHEWRLSRVKCLTPTRATRDGLNIEEKLRGNLPNELSPQRVIDTTAGGVLLRPGQVSLLVVPDVAETVQLADGSLASQVKADRLFLPHHIMTELVSYVDEYCAITAFVRVREPQYQVVRAHVGVTLARSLMQIDQDALRRDIQRVIDVYLSPVDVRTEAERRRSRQFEQLSYRFRRDNWAWEFGDSIFPSEIALLLLQVPGVAGVTHVALQHGTLDVASRRGEDPKLPKLEMLSDQTRPLVLEPYELPLCPSAFATSADDKPDPLYDHVVTFEGVQ